MQLETVTLVGAVELLVDGHHLGVGAWLDIVPRGGVVLAVPNDIWATSETGQVPVEWQMRYIERERVSIEALRHRTAI